jgi:hypothetical protein
MAEPALLIGSENVIPTLRRMELDYQHLVEAVRWADGERSLCNANDPKGFDLVMMNARLARALRDQFAGERWRADEMDNQPGIINPHLKLRVIPCNFDEYAGNPLADPTNLRGKGAASNSKTQCNQTAWMPGFEPTDEQENEYQTYVLGTHFGQDRSLRAELSKPLNFASGKYNSFRPRIILLDGTEDEVVRADSSDEGPTDIIDIAIKRK